MPRYVWAVALDFEDGFTTEEMLRAVDEWRDGLDLMIRTPTPEQDKADYPANDHCRMGEDELVLMEEFALTFGVRYYDEPHPSGYDVDPSGWVTVFGQNEDDARQLVAEHYGSAWSQLTPVKQFDGTHFESGCVHTLTRGLDG